MTTQSGVEGRGLTVKETAAAMRRELREVFPGVRFSVRMTRGTGYGWLAVTWEDGPTRSEVEAVTRAFQSLAFDGMDDAYHSTGVTRYSCTGVNHSRVMGEAGAQWVADRINAQDPQAAAYVRQGHLDHAVSGGQISPEAALRLDVRNHYLGSDEEPVPVDLAANQIFARSGHPGQQRMGA